MTSGAWRRGAAAFAAISAWIVVACQTSPQPARPRSSPAESSLPGATLVAPERPNDGNAAVRVDANAPAAAATSPTALPPEHRYIAQVAHAVSRLRGWPQLSSLPVDAASSGELSDWLAGELDAQTPQTVARLQDHGLSLLGVLPAQFDSNRAVLGVFANSIQGAYLTSQRRVVLRQGLSPEGIRSILSHEVVHAYQDQLYALGSKLRYRPRNGDAATALHALAEGEACHVELELVRGDLGSNEQDYSDDRFEEQVAAFASNVVLPSVLKRSLVAPYRDGFRFVSYLRRIGHWELVDAVWRRGLTNTAELLHPERWIDARSGLLPRADPKPVTLDRLARLEQQVELLWQETLGEQGLRILLEEIEPAEMAATLAASWRDDTIWLSRSQNGERLGWHLRIDGNAQGLLVEQALRRLLFGKKGQASSCARLTAANVALLAQHHDILVVASGQGVTGAGQRPPISCAKLVTWGRAALPMLSVTR